MATKSFQTTFDFNRKSANALANALKHSKRVDIHLSQPVNRYGMNDKDKVARDFKDLFGERKVN